MIWEILQVVSGSFFGGIIVIVLMCRGLRAIVANSNTVPIEQNLWIVVFICGMLWVASCMIVLSAFNGRYLEKEQVMCVHKCECPECSKVLETQRKEGKQCEKTLVLWLDVLHLLLLHICLSS